MAERQVRSFSGKGGGRSNNAQPDDDEQEEDDSDEDEDDGGCSKVPFPEVWSPAPKKTVAADVDLFAQYDSRPEDPFERLPEPVGPPAAANDDPFDEREGGRATDDPVGDEADEDFARRSRKAGRVAHGVGGLKAQAAIHSDDDESGQEVDDESDDDGDDDVDDDDDDDDGDDDGDHDDNDEVSDEVSDNGNEESVQDEMDVPIRKQKLMALPALECD
eukprot:5148980-Prymnesium_polylepis.1